jgi:hypothetical protein
MSRASKQDKPLYTLAEVGKQLGVSHWSVRGHIELLRITPHGDRPRRLDEDQIRMITEHRAAMSNKGRNIKAPPQSSPLFRPMKEYDSDRYTKFIQALQVGKSVIDLVLLGSSPIEADALYKWFHERQGHIMIPVQVMKHLEKVLGPVDATSLGEVVERTIASYRLCFQCGGFGAIAVCASCRFKPAKSTSPASPKGSPRVGVPFIKKPTQEEIDLVVSMNKRREQLGLPLEPVPGQETRQEVPMAKEQEPPSPELGDAAKPTNAP